MSFLDSIFGPPDVAKLAEKKDVGGLIKALGYKKDAKIRAAAAEALGSLYRTDLEFSLNLNFLGNRSALTNVPVSEVIAEPAKFFALMRVLSSDHAGAAAVFREVWRDSGANIQKLIKALSPLLPLFDDSDPEVRAAAVSSAGRITALSGSVEIASILADPMITLTSDPNPRVQSCALEGLSFLAFALIEGFKGDNQAYLKGFEALKKIGEPAVVPLILSIQNDQICGKCYYCLAEIGTKSLPEILERVRSRRLDFASSGVIIREMGDRIYPYLRSYLQDASAEVRAMAVIALQKFPCPETTGLASLALEDENPLVRAFAIDILTPAPEPRALEALQRALQVEQDQEVLPLLQTAVAKKTGG